MNWRSSANRTGSFPAGAQRVCAPAREMIFGNRAKAFHYNNVQPSALVPQLLPL